MKKDLTQELKKLLLANGADMVGIGGLESVPESVRFGLPVGVSVAVKYPKEIIQGISDLPTQEYKNWYDALNERLDRLVSIGAEFLQSYDYQAKAKTRAQVGAYGDDCLTALPHKTIATRAGIGWIGKCALLITEQYGSMIRLSSILTDAPLTASKEMNESRCGSCMACTNACPADAIYGIEWNPSIFRDELFDYRRCRAMAQTRSEQGFGQRVDLCGKCIEVCPYTQRYMKSSGNTAGLKE